ncbi:effector-associated constant component EACC1 [Kribbella speibonae]|uniref:effector-associated constant component EACC1 n=1 Tax=Kribbella speibonae TaxID=1572660 RepID=UPI0030B8489F
MSFGVDGVSSRGYLPLRWGGVWEDYGARLREGWVVGVWVEVVLVDGDPEVADRGIRQLRRELQQEFETRDVLTAAPDGSKGDAAAVGAVAVAVALGGAGGMVPLLIAVLRDWLGRRTRGQRVKLTVGDESIEVDAASPEEQRELVEAFLRRHEVS